MGTPASFTQTAAQLALATCAAALLGACAPPDQLPDAVLVSIDTLRADALGCYGNPATPSPGIDGLAERGVRFARAFAQAPSTAPSHATMFTGLSPYAHRVANFTDVEFGTPVLADNIETLAERFTEAGHDTAAFTDDGPLGRTWRLMVGFDLLHAEYEDIAVKVDRALEFLEGRSSEEPLFLFLHTYQVHQPFLPPLEDELRMRADYDGFLVERVALLRERSRTEPMGNHGRDLLAGSDDFGPAEARYLMALYHAELAYTDRELSRLWQALADRDRWEQTLLAVTSDHGEAFGEHEVFGHSQVHTETLHVPWILRLPGDRAGGTQIEQTVSLGDLPSTLLDLAGLDSDLNGTSRSLAATLEDGVVLQRPSHALTNMHFIEPFEQRPMRRSLRTERWSLVQEVSEGGRGSAATQLYDRRDDPLETRPFDLSKGETRQRVNDLERELDELLAAELSRRVGPALVERAASSAEAAEQMRALGYVEED